MSKSELICLCMYDFPSHENLYKLAYWAGGGGTSTSFVRRCVATGLEN